MLNKPSKLHEKGTRVPDARETQWQQVLSLYLSEMEKPGNETARSFRFGLLLHDLFKSEPGFIESYISGLEKYIKVKGKDRLLKGEVDNLFGNVVIEFESNLLKKRKEAEEQLRRYVAILWSQETQSKPTPYLCIAADGIRFVVFSPLLRGDAEKGGTPEDVRLELVEEADWRHLKPHQIYFWLDRYLFRKEILSPTSETMVHDFGVRSHAFRTTTNALLALWQGIRTQSSFAIIYDSWGKYLRTEATSCSCVTPISLPWLSS